MLGLMQATPFCTQFVDTNGQKLTETFPVRSRRLRPAPPSAVQLPSVDDYEVGQAVDLREHDIWWHGVAWAQSPGVLRVFLPGEVLGVAALRWN